MKFGKTADIAGFEALFYANPQPMWIFDVHTLQVLEVNDAAMAQYGYNRDEFLSKTIRDLRPTEDLPLLYEILPYIRGSKTNYREFRHLTKYGTILHAEIISYCIIYKGVRARIVYASNVDEKKELAGKLKLTQRRLLQILETTVIGFLQLDFNWTITYWNKAAESLIGYQRDDVLGRKIWDVLPEILYSEFHEYLNEAMDQRKDIDFDGYFWPVQKWFTCNAYTTEDGVIMHFRDVTQKKLAQEGLLEKIDQLKEVSFLNSHALRKPIASLLGLTQLISEEMIKPTEFKDIASLINNCSLELDNVVREINRRMGDDEYLNSLDIVAEVFNFNIMLHEVVAKIQPLYTQNPIELAPQLVHTEFYGLKQGIELAVMYLIDNAVKFSPAGSSVLVNTEIINQNLVLSVTDYGSGLDELQMQSLFIYINQKKHVNSNSGLPKINEVCRRHHGNMWMESQPGQGTAVYMRFPLSNVATYISTGETNFSVYQESDFSIQYHEDQKYIEVEWKGFHNLYSVKSNCFTIISYIRKYHCSHVLNNNKGVIGGWMEACNWLIEDFFPLLEQTGVQYLAWVYSESMFGKLSVNYTLQNLTDGISTQVFDDNKSALDWLIKQ